MISINVNQDEVRAIIKDQISKLARHTDSDLVFWDSAELKKRTCMSWNTIQDTFFFDPRFPKKKVGNKWYYPVRETKKFLEQWLLEQE